MNKLLYDTQRKILARDELAREVKRRQQAGERAVFTNGCFDLLHLGHVRYLQEARAQGDFLILGLNDDAGVRALKGAGRPLVPEQERAGILAALSCVDYLTVFAEPTALWCACSSRRFTSRAAIMRTQIAICQIQAVCQRQRSSRNTVAACV